MTGPHCATCIVWAIECVDAVRRVFSGTAWDIPEDFKGYRDVDIQRRSLYRAYMDAFNGRGFVAIPYNIQNMVREAIPDDESQTPYGTTDNDCPS